MKKLVAPLFAAIALLVLSAPALHAGTDMAAAPPLQDQFAPPPNGYWVPAPTPPPVAYYPPPYVVVAPPPYYYAYGPRYYYYGPRYRGGVSIALPGLFFSFGGHHH